MKAPIIRMSASQMLSNAHNPLQIFLFGHLQIKQDDQPPSKPLGQKVAALLAYLACNPGPHARARLAELFWKDIPPDRFLPNLRSTLNRLPKALKAYIRTTQHSVALELTDDIWIDVLAFQKLAECLPQSASVISNDYTAHLDQVAEQLQAMGHLYQGEFLEGLTLDDAPGFSQWLVMQRSSLARLALDGLRHLTYLYLHQGRYAEGVAYVKRMMELDPQDEEAQRLLPLLLAHCGEAQVVRQVHPPRKAFKASLEASLKDGGDSEGVINPAAVTIENVHQPTPIVESTDQLSPIKVPPLTELFIGRQAELAALMHELRTPHCRLLTVTGLGGIGKTCLALEAARALEQDGDFIHGIYFVPLEGIQSGERIPEAILHALNVVLPGQDDLLVALCNYLVSKNLLFIFDNFEHLVTRTDIPQGSRSGEPVDPYVSTKILAQLLQAAPNIKFMVTSRQPLQLQQEHLFPLAGLHFLQPNRPHSLAELGQNDAVRLFLQVAVRVNRAFQLTEANKQAVLEFCRLVQGVPLAIVLGAAQMDCLTPQQLVETHQENIDVLEIDWVDLPERQQSVRALFDYSWQRLDPTLRQIFAQLTIFQGGFTRRAAQQVVGASLPQLRQLYHHSLIQQTAQGRYQIHELLRQLGAEKLAALKNRTQMADQMHHGAPTSEQVTAQAQRMTPAGVYDRHMQFYLTWLARQRETLQGRKQQEAAADILVERNNLRQAWQHAVTTQHVAMLADSVESYHLFYEIQGLYQERLAVVTDAIQALEPTIRQRYGSDGAEAREDIVGITHKDRQNATASDALDLEAYCLLLASQGDCFIAMGNSQQAIHNAQLLIAYTKLLSSGWNPNRRFYGGKNVGLDSEQGPGENSRPVEFLQAWSYRIWSRGLSMHGEDRAAKELADQAIAAAQRAADPMMIADGLQMRGNTHLLLAQTAAAEADFQQAYALYIQNQNLHKAINSLERLGSHKVWAADLQAAQKYYEQAIALNKELHDQPSHHHLHFNLSRVSYKMGAYHSAEQKTQAALRFFNDVGDRWLTTEAHYFLGKLYCSAGQYQRAQHHQAEALQISRLMNAQRNQIICLARLGITLTYLGHYQQALDLMHEAETLACELQVDPVRSHILICSANTLQCAGRTAQSIARYREAFALYAPAELGYQKVEAMTGLAYALCQAGNRTAAAGYIEELTASLTLDLHEMHTLAEPFVTYLNYYRVLEACQDQRASSILEQAYILLQQWVKQMDDEQWRRSFLEHVVANRELIRLYKKQQAAAVPQNNGSAMSVQTRCSIKSKPEQLQ